MSLSRSLSITSDIFDALRKGDTPESIKSLFQSFGPKSDTLSLKAFGKILNQHGFSLEDPFIQKYDQNNEKAHSFPSKIDLHTFQGILRKNVRLHNALTGRLMIPNLPGFKDKIGELFLETKKDCRGSLASCPKQLLSVDPDLYGVSFCSVDGQRFNFGDTNKYFTVQDCSQPITYCMALEEHGIQKVHELVGWEPSGRGFNERILNSSGKPHNPMITSGSMITSAMIKHNLVSSDRWEYINSVWSKLCGNDSQFSINNSMYLTKKANADREWCLAYMMEEENGWPNTKNGYSKDSNHNEALEFYFMLLSLEATTKDLAVAAATLANGGVCPVTEKVIFSPVTVKSCLSIMFTCGMYENSGEFVFNMGFPAKSGSSGALMIVIPGLGGFCAYSPRLESYGYSARGYSFCAALSRTYRFHNFENQLSSKEKLDPRSRTPQGNSAKILLWYAAYWGNLTLIRHIAARGIKLDSSDYDQRTGLHLASCSGHKEIVQYLLNRGVSPSLTDRFGNTPIDDANREGNNELVQLLTRETHKTFSAENDVIYFSDLSGKSVIRKRDILHELANLGLNDNDPRILNIFREIPETTTPEIINRLVDSNRLLKRAFTGTLLVPDWMTFSEDIKELYKTTKSNNSGQITGFIPQLAEVDPELYAVSVCTIDGQQFNIGDSNVPFSLQACCMPLNYLVAQEECKDEVHKYIGREPSGGASNELVMNSDGLPHNPFTNAGAIMTCALIREKFQNIEEHYYVHMCNQYSRLAGGVKPSFDNAVYLSERARGDRNYCLTYLMREKGVIPIEKLDVQKTLDFYFMCRSLTYTTKDLALIAATLAAGGRCPTTDEQVFNSTHVKNCLSLMNSCGMNDFSGAFAFRVGFPAKSGISGCLMVVVPNVMGICTFSPRLNELENSVRGIQFCELFGQKYNFHSFDAAITLYFGDSKSDPRQFPMQKTVMPVSQLLYAASIGDIREIHKLYKIKVSLDSKDYDGRTALHLAASEGQEEVVRYLVMNNASVDVKDRWGTTPLDDAIKADNKGIVEFLQSIKKKDVVENEK